MPRLCTICTHAKRDDIDRDLVAGELPNRRIAAQYAVSEQSLRRHAEQHIPAALVKAEEAAEVAAAGTLLDQVTDLRLRAVRILDTAEKAGELRSATAAIREARACLELLGKLAGELRDGPTVNVLLSPDWQRVQGIIVEALAPYPEARYAVVEALGAVSG